MSEPLVSIPLSLAKRIARAARSSYWGSFDDDYQFDMEIEKAEREAELNWLTQQDQDRYKDTVNPLVRPSNE